MDEGGWRVSAERERGGREELLEQCDEAMICGKHLRLSELLSAGQTEAEGETKGTDRETDRQTDRQPDRQTYQQTKPTTLKTKKKKKNREREEKTEVQKVTTTATMSKANWQGKRKAEEGRGNWQKGGKNKWVRKRGSDK